MISARVRRKHQGQRSRRKPGAYDTSTPEKEAFGKRMRLARQTAGMTLEEAATAMGYAQPVQLCNMENGNRMPNVSVLQQCAQIYGTTMDFLCGLSPDVERDPATLAMLHVTGRVTADVQRLIKTLTSVSVSAVRELMPGHTEGLRLSSLAIDMHNALSAFKRLNPRFDGMRGSATLAAKAELAVDAATRYAAQIDRAKRLMSARANCSLAPQQGEGVMQMALLPDM